jgi:hypothetical protein
MISKHLRNIADAIEARVENTRFGRLKLSHEEATTLIVALRDLGSQASSLELTAVPDFARFDNETIRGLGVVVLDDHRPVRRRSVTHGPAGDAA